MSGVDRPHAPPQADSLPPGGAPAGLGRPGASSPRPAPRLAVLISFSGEGGPERMVLNLVD